jgi:ribosomal protein S18 acetylase RimI-like enzyme
VTVAPSVRLAKPDDVASIVPWTTDTFSWGDYIPERIHSWLEDDDSDVLVWVDGSDIPLAICHVMMLSPTEGWLEGARVHPEHRRRGLGSILNEAGVEWARARGGRVIRLSTDAWNIAARNQVKALGYREVSRWLHAEFAVDATHRSSERYRMRPAPGGDAEAAWLFWVGSDLARESRELIAHGWHWRSARPDDVSQKGGSLVQSAAGWALIEQPEDDWLRTNWIASTPEDMLGLIDGLLDLAAERGVSELDIKLPDLPWTSEAIVRSGGEPNSIVVHAKPIH